jgi:hypothetical protein
VDCPHCGIAFHDRWQEVPVYHSNNEDAELDVEANRVWLAKTTTCPACKDNIIRLTLVKHIGTLRRKNIVDFIAYPQSTFRKPTPAAVPPDIKVDYEEACRTLPISEKASAALSRRCLQGILRGQGYAQKDLAQQIDALLKEPDPTKAIPTGLRDTVDAIRNFGNFSAHPVTDQTTLQIVPVDKEEAEWCLEILEEMFDHYYVKPAQAAARKAALNQKLAAAKKPPAK